MRNNPLYPIYLGLPAITFIDDNFEPYDGKTVYLDNFRTALHQINPMSYAIVIANLIGLQDFSGLGVLDLGCADGALGLVAKINGANRVIGVDNSLQRNDAFYSHIQANGFSLDDFELNEDIKNKNLE